jgi:formamidopyrimidine-DNA glycosylase
MPELPDLTVYVEALRARILGEPLERLRLSSPFLLRTADPPLSTVEGRRVVDVRRMGKRIVLALEGELYLAIHLMIAEAGTRRRAALHVLRGEEALRALDRGGLEVLEADLSAFRRALLRESHTLKRALTDPRLFSGIGNAYSDEILHRARLSPVKLTGRLTEEEAGRLFGAARAVLQEWMKRLRAEAGAGFPEGVTAFRDGMAVHGRYRQPCPDCAAPVQRIVYAENETNYCPRCQTGGRILSDRSLARLLKQDWPGTVEEMERLETRRTGRG